MASTILLVEDESAIREMLVFTLGRAGFDVTEAEDVVEAERCIASKCPDLMLVDWMLPGMSGVDWVRRLKKDELTREIPIIMLTARGEENDKVRGLESGADDYVTKPFSNKELVARINASLRRTSGYREDGCLSVGDMVLDLESHRLKYAGEVIELGPTEFRLLSFFMKHPERVYSRSQLLDFVWSRDTYVEERTVDVHILRLRKALTPYKCDAYIQTVRGAGYRFSVSNDDKKK